MREAALGRPLRCAIYTRKSTEEGLEQDFNSLDAQREACAAYILSQRHEGWVALPDIYDDGGFSGGNMERPGLRALLAEISAGKVDIIVVYKVDRLTRSLADFAKIVEVLDARGASFVSVTQAFNTTTSMGRLTLNVLLSFAQFEREVTGERIRDKIAASKAKGMWMGGPVPLGYQLGERKLEVSEAEAKIVRHIFTRYLELGSGRELVAELAMTGVRSKPRVNRHGRAYGDQAIGRGAVYAILQNRLYIGDVSHKGKHYPGQHEAIINRALFDAVQARLQEQRSQNRSRTNAAHASMLTGLLRDEFGRRMSPSHTNNHGRRYRYYVSQNDGADKAEPVWRVSAADLEQRVVHMLQQLIAEQRDRVVAEGQLGADAAMKLNGSAAFVAAQLTDPARGNAHVQQLVSTVTLTSGEITISAELAGVYPALAGSGSLICSAPIACVRSGKQTKLIIPSAEGEAGRSDAALVKLMVQGWSLREALARQSSTSFKEVAEAFGYSREHSADLLRMSYLAPDITSAILTGTQPLGLTRTRLIKTAKLPLRWEAQRRELGFQSC